MAENSAPPPPPSDPAGLQFDRAEPHDPVVPSAVCAACRRPLSELYYVAQGVKICKECRTAFEQKLRGGSGWARFLRALIFGIGAAGVGSAINYLVTVKEMPGSNLVILLIGFFVGRSVRRGSGNRGGWRYQALAMMLTYLSIVGTYVPAICEGIRDRGSSFLIVAAVLLAPFRSMFMLILTAIALYEAWKVNKGLRVEFKGPYRIAGAPPEAKPVG
jgi:hypothetical protein